MILPESPSGSPKRSPEVRSFKPASPPAYLFWPQGAYMPNTGAFDRIKAHEDLCAERYQAIHETLREMKQDSKSQNRLIIGVLLALVGWMGVQLWSGGSHVASVAQAVAGVLK